MAHGCARAPRREAGPDGRVYVVHAYGPPADWLGSPLYNRVLADHQKHRRAVIDGLALEDDDLLGTNWESELLEGPAADAILGVAEAWFRPTPWRCEPTFAGAAGASVASRARLAVKYRLASVPDSDPEPGRRWTAKSSNNC
jgi:hypothetical protein